MEWKSFLENCERSRAWLDSSGRVRCWVKFIFFRSSPPFRFTKVSQRLPQEADHSLDVWGQIEEGPPRALTECYDELGNRYQLPVYCLAPPINMIEEKGDLETLDIPEPPPNSGHECQLRLRLSTGKDLKLLVRSMDTVYHMKRRLHAVEGVEPASQRWFFSGRPLADKMKLEELKIPKDYVVQVIVSQPLANPTPVKWN
ncbi:hypothetical protein IHE44_0003958 [Lamprotornis superbus]|uniref:Ubiquitin-like domain-containing protein n=1 Tax=Lamprotornis superbus TaxID=245042 RepID=A0A835TZ45_9PASS|nr:hypothetical protein IHE44_0003958 [Lamprotornis superbus]